MVQVMMMLNRRRMCNWGAVVGADGDIKCSRRRERCGKIPFVTHTHTQLQWRCLCSPCHPPINQSITSLNLCLVKRANPVLHDNRFVLMLAPHYITRSLYQSIATVKVNVRATNWFFFSFSAFSHFWTRVQEEFNNNMDDHSTLLDGEDRRTNMNANRGRDHPQQK